MKNVRDYCIPSCTIPAFVSVMLIPVGVIFNAAMSDLGNDMEKALALFMTIATNLVGIPFVWFSFYFNSKIRFEKRLKVCTLSVSEDMIASDFEESSTFFNDKIRVGNNCIFGRGTGVFALFDEIRSINIHRSEDRTENFSVNWQVLITTYSDRFTLYSLKRCSYSEWKRFVEYIRMVAPHIEIEKMTFSATEVGMRFQSYPGNPYNWQ